MPGIPGILLSRSNWQLPAVPTDVSTDYKDVPGGDERDRTADPLLAKQVLSQLSYIPRGSTGTGSSDPVLESIRAGGPSWD